MRRQAFTLVELLVTIAIIGILAGAMITALNASAEHAKATKTRSTISKLNALIAEHWESYRTRRLSIQRGIDNQGNAFAETDQGFTLRKLHARRELMRLEMPDRYSDIEQTATYPALTPLDMNGVPASAAHRAYAKKVNAAGGFGSVVTDNQSAECLYLIMTVGIRREDGPQFKDREIADTDNDGMPEFVDGWGNPIEFIRWAPGFASDVQSQDPVAQHDPFDPIRLEQSPSKPAQFWDTNSGSFANVTPAPPAHGFLLYPLIVSPGPDAEYGLYFLPLLSPVDKEQNPYSTYTSGGEHWRGEPDLDYDNDGTNDGEWHLDNIHNHTDLVGR